MNVGKVKEMSNKHLPFTAVLSLALLFASVSPVLAEDSMTTTASTTTISPSKSPMASASPKTTAAPLKKVAEVMKDKTASKGADLKEKLMVASGGGTLKDKLKAFRDQKKADIIERISKSLATVNQKRTSEMLRHIDTMNGILAKAQDRASAASGEGKDTSGVVSDLTSATNALANAKTAVETQSKKSYDIKISSESGAKADVRLTRDALQKDLKSTHELVAEARRTLINALIKLAQALGEQVNATN